MYIHEAIVKAWPEQDSVYRRAWLEDFVIVEKVRVLKATRPMCHEVYVSTGHLDHPWKPTPEDLLANDWEVYRPIPKSEGFVKRYLGRWNL